MTGTLRRLAAVLCALALAGALCVSSARAAEPPLHVLTIGDSITAAGQWQQEFVRLAATYGATEVHVDNVAVPGTRCSYWPPRIGELLAQYQPDAVVFFCGTNDDPTEVRYGESATSWSWRYMVETIRAFRPANPVVVVPAFIQYSDPLVAPDWLLRNEPVTNDTIYREIVRHMSWFPGIVDLQKIPATATYLDDGGIHPTAAGYRVMGRLTYDATRSAYHWPVVGPDELPLCDLYGHRKGYPRPAYTPCSWTGG